MAKNRRSCQRRDELRQKCFYLHVYVWIVLAACNRSPTNKEQPIIDLSQRGDNAKLPSTPVGRDELPTANPPETKMIRVPTASFIMGADNGMENERPAHKVAVRGFLIDAYEVTAFEYEACIAAKSCPKPSAEAKQDPLCNIGQSGRQKHPANCVDWHQATAFCRWVDKRLPTEEEWELAARGKDGRKYPWGNVPPTSQLCWKEENTCATDQFPEDRSAFGVFGMAGNVREWTASVPDAANILNRDSPERIARGGSWGTRNVAYIRASARVPHPETRELPDLGMRCAKDVL